jgi:hypothetical protein
MIKAGETVMQGLSAVLKSAIVLRGISCIIVKQLIVHDNKTCYYR